MKVEQGTARKIWPCNFKGCRRKIAKGQEYFLWHVSPGFKARRQHQDHGAPAQPAPKKKTTKKAVAKVTAKKTSKKVAKKKAQKKGGKNNEQD